MNQVLPILSSGPYPGETATPTEILALADAYRDAAMTLSRRTMRTWQARQPVWLLLIHSMELYLNAARRHWGETPGEVRGRLHNIYDPALCSRLKLRKKTAAFLKATVSERRYLATRYAAEAPAGVNQPSAPSAALADVSKKVQRHLS